jgi:site-specific recombinase XerD
MEKTFRLTFFLKSKKKGPDEDPFVFMRITIDGERKEISTKIDCPRDIWNQKIGRATSNKPAAKQLNSYLDSVSMKVLQARQVLLDAGKDITVDAIKNLLLGRSEQNLMLLEVFKQHNEQMDAQVGIGYAQGTMERYVTSLEHTRTFIQWKYGKDDIEIRKLNYEFISDYEFWFKTVRKCSHNTTIKYLTNMKKIVLSCVKKGWLAKNPFVEYKMVKKEVHRESLDEVELMRISKREFSMDRLNQIKDIFIFSCYTGLAYADVKNLKKDNIITGIDGNEWISVFRQKTDSPTRLPLLPEALAILKKYEKHPGREITGQLLPIPSNQKMNAYLKEIADLCEIKKELSSHIARHTFATTITLGNGVPIETVSKMLGHKSIKQTQLYAKIMDTKISFEMQALREKLELRKTNKFKL